MANELKGPIKFKLFIVYTGYKWNCWMNYLEWRSCDEIHIAIAYVTGDYSEWLYGSSNR